MKTTPFTSIHKSLGAKMAPFAGYDMPISYAGTLEEHMTVVDRVGVFDISHMGALVVSGPQALPFLQDLCSNDLSKLTQGKAQYNYFPNDKGGIVDDFILYHLGDRYMLAVNAANIQKDYEWLQSHLIQGVHLSNDSERVAILAIQGPKAKDTLQKLVDTDLDELPFYTFTEGKFLTKKALISNTGYTGAGGYELYFWDLDDPKAVWDALMEAGEEFGIRPIGLGARDTLRLEMGYCLYGQDIDETTSPLEAGLGWVTKLNDDKHTPGKDILLKQKENGLVRKLVAFEVNDKGIPRHGYDIVDESQQVIGQVTSGTISPFLGKGIGLGYVAKGYEKVGTTIGILQRKKVIPATVIKLPFRK